MLIDQLLHKYGECLYIIDYSKCYIEINKAKGVMKAINKILFYEGVLKVDFTLGTGVNNAKN